MSNQLNNQQDILLRREASMSAMSLGQGLTSLRKYDFGQTGYFYSSLLQLATGIERLLKLIIIYEHRLNHNRFPDNKELRNYGHNINELFLHSIEIAEEFECSELIIKSSENSLCNKIIILLSDFAMQSRYYNLDILTGRMQRNNIEPLARWEDEINSLIIKKHFRPRKSTIAQWKKVVETIGEKAVVRYTHESGEEINSFREMAQHGMKANTKQKYSMYYVYIIVRYLSNLLKTLEYKGQFYPFLREFFFIFMIENRSEILRKKSWNPLPPYKF